MTASNTISRVLNIGKRVLFAVRTALESKAFAIFMFLCACRITYTQNEVSGALFFLTVICLQLLLCENTYATLAPFLMLCVFICTCYDSFKVFIVYLPFAPIAIMCVIFHFVVYRKGVTLGQTFIPLCVTALAVTLGGAGVIPPEDYFAPGAMFYTFGLGVGMVIMYLLFRSRYISTDPEMQKKLRERFAFDMYLMGLITAVCIFSFYLRELEALKEKFEIVHFQAQNNFSTFLMFALPFPLYFTMNREEKCSGNSIIRMSDLHVISFFVMYLAILLTDSRGGLIFGTIEFFVCIAYAIYNRSGRRRYIYLLGAIGVIVATYFGGQILLDHLRDAYTQGITSTGEARSQLLWRAIDDFKRNILFGSGLGYKGNSDLYNPVQGAMNWYHIYPAQIVGSFGLFGIIAFGGMIIHRFSVFLRSPNAFKLTLGLSYIGVLLMSLVNPGEFCPVPYEMMVVLIFVMLEDESQKHRALAFKIKL